MLGRGGPVLIGIEAAAGLGFGFALAGPLNLTPGRRMFWPLSIGSMALLSGAAALLQHHVPLSIPTAVLTSVGGFSGLLLGEVVRRIRTYDPIEVLLFQIIGSQLGVAAMAALPGSSDLTWKDAGLVTVASLGPALGLMLSTLLLVGPVTLSNRWAVILTLPSIGMLATRLYVGIARPFGDETSHPAQTVSLAVSLVSGASGEPIAVPSARVAF